MTCHLPRSLVGWMLAPVLTAQCPTLWSGGFGCPGVDGPVHAAAAWDVDGAGPSPAWLVLGGDLQRAGSLPCAGLVAWDPVAARFVALPAPPLPVVTAIAVAGADLFVACTSDPATQGRVVQWSGGAWSVLGPDFDQPVDTLRVRASGALVAGGHFTAVGPVAATSVATWNGANWQAVGTLFGTVRAFDELANGDLLAAGATNLGGVVRWDGVAWSAVGNLGQTSVRDLAVVGAAVVAVDDFAVRLWQGGVWSVLLPPSSITGHWPRRVLGVGGNAVLVGGLAIVQGLPTHALAIDVASNTWTALSPATSPTASPAGDATDVFAIARLPGGATAVGGAFATSGGLDVANVVLHDGSQWRALADGPPASMAAAVPLANGDLVVGGSFRTCGNLPARGVARWNGAVWSALGSGLDGRVFALAQLPNGDLIAGGDFHTAGAVVARGLARWDGSSWSEFAGGIAGAASPFVTRLSWLRDGRLAIGGSFTSVGGTAANGVAIWQGGVVGALGNGVVGPVVDLLEADDGALLAAVSQRVQRWDGATWSTAVVPTSPLRSIAAIATQPNGRIVVGGQDALFVRPFLEYHGVGAPQAFVGVGGAIGALLRLPDGDLLAVGPFSQFAGVQANGLVRASAASPGSFAAVPGGQAAAMTMLPDGRVLAIGMTARAPGTSSYAIALLASTCPAEVVVSASGCLGSAVAALTPRTLAWLGSTHLAVAHTLPANALGVHVLGLAATNLPLAAVWPQALPGCALRVTPDVLGLLATGAGSATLALSIPDAPVLLGAIVHEQLVALQFDASGGIAAVAATDALRLTLGDF